MKKFGLGARHHCRFCGNSVCGKHSSQRILEDSKEKTRICDTCDIELIKEQIRSEINEELAKLKDNIEITKENYDKLEEEKQEKSEVLSKIEEALMDAERNFRAKDDELLKRLNEEELKSKKNNDLMDSITRALDISHKNEKEMSEKCLKLEDKLDEIRNETLKAKENKTELCAQLEHLSIKLKSSLPLEEVSMILCEKCKQRALVNYRAQNKDSVASS